MRWPGRAENTDRHIFHCQLLPAVEPGEVVSPHQPNKSGRRHIAAINARKVSAVYRVPNCAFMPVTSTRGLHCAGMTVGRITGLAELPSADCRGPSTKYGLAKTGSARVICQSLHAADRMNRRVSQSFAPGKREGNPATVRPFRLPDCSRLGYTVKPKPKKSVETQGTIQQSLPALVPRYLGGQFRF